MKEFQGEDYYEGDSKYLAPEALSSNFRFSKLCYKCDIFSLGLSFAEILFKIELPQSGILWERIRKENFYFESDQILNSNMRNNIDPELVKLIYLMINAKVENRPSIDQIMEGFSELSTRNIKMLKNVYIRNYNPSSYMDIEDDSVSNSKNYFNK